MAMDAVATATLPSTRRPRPQLRQTGILTASTEATGRHVSFVTAPYEETEEPHSSPAQEQAASDSAPSSPPTPAHTSKTNLILPRKTRSEGEGDALRAVLPRQRSTSLSSLGKGKGKGRAASLHSGPHIHPSPNPSPVQERPPAPPTEVLTRDATEEPGTSAGAAVVLQQALQPPVATADNMDVVMRDRMLVRILHSKQDGFARYMDEAHLAELTDVRQEECGEFIVVWRRGRIELYEDYVRAHAGIARFIPH